MGLLDFLFGRSKRADILQEKFDFLLDKAYNPAIKNDDITQLDENEKIFFALYIFNMEIQNGGLCQFFVNSSRIYAPLISEYLEIVGATKHQKLYDNFVKTHHLDVTDLSFFVFDDLSLYQEKAEAYPFDDFDDAFYELPELEKFIEDFMKSKM